MTFLPPRIKRASGKKDCPTCGKPFFRDARKHGNKQWAARVFCSHSCASQKALWLRLEEQATIVGDCWQWTGSVDVDGYGRLTIKRNGKRTDVRAHRASFETYVGAIPEGMVVRHSCDNPGCINPLHLEVGSHADNAADKVARGRVARLGKLTAEDVRAIRASTESHGSLARRFGVTRQSIRYARSGKTWGAIA